ncbi:hypothetical protein DY000_02018041 [Brassica cretica]|uniref:Uncharacterized protein n=1 Tax=Brassica cretica TaxID=69181 RepID=A0ABQ7D5N7_BRACR|nr:hypothetical protein DY000_02018041 [Brassica cretica]
MGMISLYPNFVYLVFSAEALLHSIHGDLEFLEKIIVSSNLSFLTSFLSSLSSFSHTEQRNRSVLSQRILLDGSVHYEIEVFLSSMSSESHERKIQEESGSNAEPAQVFPPRVVCLFRQKTAIKNEVSQSKPGLSTDVLASKRKIQEESGSNAEPAQVFPPRVVR